MLGFNLGFVGAGQMARAIGVSLIQKGLLKPSQVTVSSPEKSHLEYWKGHGCNTSFQNGDVVEASEIVMWSTKPQFFEAALKATQLKSSTTDKFHISIMAGCPLDNFAKMIGSHLKSPNTRAARVMPNIAMRVGAGVSVYTMGSLCQDSDKNNLTKLLSSVGLCYEVPENQINAYCGLFASGIGFMFPVLEGMADGGVKMGIPRDVSMQIAAQTMKGAAELLLASNGDSGSSHPGQLKDSVCSPGGTTIAGVAALENFGVRNAFIQAIEASTNRGEELDKKSRE